MCDKSEIIWRFMELWKFRSILEQHAIYFARPRTFDDKWEGHWHPGYWRNTREFYGSDEGLAEEFETRVRRRRHGFLVSCWHRGRSESQALWAQYTKDGPAVAIQSTIGDALHSLRPHNYGIVQYYHPEDEPPKLNGIIGHDDILLKRDNFQYEREFRMWFMDDSILEKLGADYRPLFDVTKLPDGEHKGITEMDSLIHKVIVSPDSSDAFFEEVKELCANHNGHQKTWLANRVQRSPIESDPMAYV